MERGHCGTCPAPTGFRRHRPRPKAVAARVSVILGFALFYAFRGYTRAWIYGEPMEERVEGGLIAFVAGIVIWTVVVSGFLIYEHYKDR